VVKGKRKTSIRKGKGGKQETTNNKEGKFHRPTSCGREKETCTAEGSNTEATVLKKTSLSFAKGDGN